MSAGRGTTRHARQRLTRERVLRAAVTLADREGVAALSMRRLAGELGYEVMSLYHHVANKDEVLDGMVELVAGEIELPTPGTPWRDAARQTAVETHHALGRHPWATSLWFSRRFGPARTAIMESQLRTLHEAGIEPELAHIGFHAVNNHVLGSALQEQSFVVEGDERVAAERFVATLPPEEFPHLIGHVHQHLESAAPVDEFGFVLDLILDRLAAGR